MRGIHRTKAELLPEEDFDPLFSYSKIQPPLVLDDDDDEPALPLKWQKRLKKKARLDDPKPVAVEPPAPGVVDELDWLAPPPKIAQCTIPMNDISTTVLQLRQKRLELMEIANHSCPVPSAPTIRPAVVKTSGEALRKRAAEVVKVKIFVQDKGGNRQQYAISKTERLERLFSAYADSVGLKSTNLVFKFDGQPLAPTSSLTEHEIEDEDQIEVFCKPTKR